MDGYIPSGGMPWTLIRKSNEKSQFVVASLLKNIKKLEIKTRIKEQSKTKTAVLSRQISNPFPEYFKKEHGPGP